MRPLSPRAESTCLQHRCSGRGGIQATRTPGFRAPSGGAGFIADPAAVSGSGQVKDVTSPFQVGELAFLVSAAFGVLPPRGGVRLPASHRV